MVRRVRPESVLATFATLFAAACADHTPMAPTPAAGPSLGLAKPGAPVTPARYLVGFSAPTTSIPSSVLAASGGSVVDAIPALKILVVDGVTNPAALQQAPGAQYVEAEFEVQTDDQVFPLDGATAEPDPSAAPFYVSKVQWDIKAMHADEAWAAGATGAGTKVCIVDSGVDENHQEIAGKVLARKNFVTSPASQTPADSTFDRNGHGSHVAGEAAGRGVVTSGVAPGAQLLAARVLNNSGSGSETAIINGIKWCGDQGAHVINVSIGGIRYVGQPGWITSLNAYAAGVNYARAKGAVVVISAGNSNLQLPNPGNAQATVPAQVPTALTVGATGPTSKIPQLAAPNWDPFNAAQVWQGVDAKAYYSNWGTGVDVFAPGGRGSLPYSVPFLYVGGAFQGGPYDNIYGVCAGTTTQTGAVTNSGGVPTSASGNCRNTTNRYIAYAGTSMAAPHVTGMAAVLYGAIGGAPSVASRDRVENCITSTTDNIGPASTFGGGRVNLKKALDALTGGSC